jgi:hypothetical protein
VHDGKGRMRRGPLRVEPRDDRFGAVEECTHFTPLTLILAAP